MCGATEVVVVYAGETPPASFDASLYLAGPTPRAADVVSWRPQALAEVFRQWCRPGRVVVYLPEARDGHRCADYMDMLSWELRYAATADEVLFWIPRGPGMPGLTTNDEWGWLKDSGRVVLGTPAGAEHVRYQRHYAASHGIPLADTLPDTVRLALGRIGAGAPRTAGQCEVPLLVWRTESFQYWLSAQQQAGNRLEGGRLLWSFQIDPGSRWVFFWAFHARVYVAAEDRVKSNEVVLGRPDITTLVAYRRCATVADSEVVLVREFRSPAVSLDGFVRELPGGSGLTGGDPIDQAVAEFADETGFTVEMARIRVHAARQPVAALAAHRQHVFSVELTEEEISQLRADTRVHGLAGDTERTVVEVRRFGELLTGREVDWTTLGILAQILLS